MSNLSKRTTVYIEPGLLKALRLKSLETSRTVSDVVNEAIRTALGEDVEDLEAFEQRAKEPVMTFEALLKELKRDGKI